MTTRGIPHQSSGPGERWRPLSARHDPARAKDFEMLHEDVSALLRDSLLEWLGPLVGFKDPTDPSPWASRVRWRRGLRSRVAAALRTRIRGDVDELPTGIILDVVDFVLRETDSWQADHLMSLEERLSEGGSAWRATPRGLERRVDETLRAVGESTFGTEARSAQHLRDAWHKASSRNPDASGAYRDGVRAVEAAYARIVSPRNERATLGTIIRDIRSDPSKFGVRLRARDSAANVCRLLAMLELLWQSEFDRHGTAGTSVPPNVSIEEARDAIALATTLVHLAQEGGFTA